MSTAAIQRLRAAQVWINAKKAAIILSCDESWVRKSKNNFSYRRKGKKLLEFELSSIIEYHEQNAKQ